MDMLTISVRFALSWPEYATWSNVPVTLVSMSSGYVGAVIFCFCSSNR